ncbi:uncharacterized protein ISCGN_028318 [Ixodes scapularis]
MFPPFKKKIAELSTQRGCLIWGSRVVIPTAARAEAMNLLHAGHKGIVSMKLTARSHLWWPAIDREIESTVDKCAACQESRPLPHKVPLPTWDQPSRPWDTIHLDFAGNLEGQMFLGIVDAYTKWLEDRLLAEMLMRHKYWIVSYHEHDSLLQNVVEEDLTEEERKLAWEEFEEEGRRAASDAGASDLSFFADALSEHCTSESTLHEDSEDEVLRILASI